MKRLSDDKYVIVNSSGKPVGSAMDLNTARHKFRQLVTGGATTSARKATPRKSVTRKSVTRKSVTRKSAVRKSASRR